MKKLIIFLTVSLLSMSISAADLSREQKKLRLDAVAVLTKAGYHPILDEDDDIGIEENGKRYYITVNEMWEEPYMLSIITSIPYSEFNNISRDNIESLVSMINQHKGVKLYSGNDNYFILFTDIICNDISTFEDGFKRVLKEQASAEAAIRDLLGSGLYGFDLTGNKDTLYDKATELYNNGDFTQAIKLYEYLADNNYPLAYSMLGEIYQNGHGVVKDESKMLKNYQKAIENGETWRAYNIGEYYYNKKNYPKAIEYFNYNSGIENPSRSDSYYMLGLMNENGEGMPRNMNEAVNNYRKSVEYSTNIDSEARLALMRLNQTVESPSEFTDISKSLLSGLTAEEMYQKGYEFENGLNNRGLSLPKAYGYYKAAADRNHPKAILKMGEIYLSPYYPFSNKNQADKYYQKAYKTLKQKEGYDGESNYQLGMMYKEGLGVEKDTDLAISYFKKAANKGVPQANYELGQFYQKENENVEAFNCYLKAAQQKVPGAMLAVADFYNAGKGTERNRQQAIAWYIRCKNSHSSYSREAAKALERMGSVDDEKE